MRGVLQGLAAWVRGIFTRSPSPVEPVGDGAVKVGGTEKGHSLEGARAILAAQVDTGEGWAVYPATPPAFEKVGRAFLDDRDLVIRIDGDPRVFHIREKDLDKALTDGEGKVRSTGNSRPVGTTRLSTSGRALNIIIGETLYTIPLRWLMLVLSRKRRKAAVWKGK